MSNNASWLDLIKTIVGGLLALGFIILIRSVEEVAAIIRLVLFFSFWLLLIFVSIFVDSSEFGAQPKLYNWRRFSLKHDWGMLLFRIIMVIFWTVMIHGAFFYGGGLEKDPYYR